MALVTEPNKIPSGNWLGETCGVAAICWNKDEPCALAGRGKGYVAAERGNFILVSMYCSPNARKIEFEKLIEDIENNILSKYKGKKVILGGDLNARARAWDRKYNFRGHLLEEWAANNELTLMNDGKADTCVRAQGSSMVDVTLGTEAAMKVFESWSVDEYTETLSDYKYIRIQTDSKDSMGGYAREIEFPKWNTSKINKDWFAASVLGGNWLLQHKITSLIERGEMDKVDYALKRMVSDACDNAMTRTKGGGNTRRKKVYWWNDEIAIVSSRCSLWRRRLTRAKSRKSLERVSQSAEELKQCRKDLRIVIGVAKKKALDELLGLSGDPWGRPYKTIMNKIRLNNFDICRRLP